MIFTLLTEDLVSSARLILGLCAEVFGFAVLSCIGIFFVYFVLASLYKLGKDLEQL